MVRVPHINAEVIGREEIRAGAERLWPLLDCFVQTAHPGTIVLNGDTASGRAYIQELIRSRDGRPELNHAIYHDRYQRTPDGWKFTERVYEIRYPDHSPLARRPGTRPRRKELRADTQGRRHRAAQAASAETAVTEAVAGEAARTADALAVRDAAAQARDGLSQPYPLARCPLAVAPSAGMLREQAGSLARRAASACHPRHRTGRLKESRA